MFQLTMLPARDGDCIILDYGTADKQHHVLIDGGRVGAYETLLPRLQKIADRQECIDLLVLTHIDADHIEGLLPLIAEKVLPVAVKQVWYNGFDQLGGLELYGEAQADRFSAALKERGWPWNADFRGGPVVLPANAPLQIEGPGGLKITLLSPTRAALNRLLSDWRRWREVQVAADESVPPPGLEVYGSALAPIAENVIALATTATPEDKTVPNGSSIAFIAEFGNRRVLLAADAHPADLLSALNSLAQADFPELHLVKLSHHGSKSNTTAALVRRMNARRYAISSSGSRHKHPDAEAIARIIHFGPSSAELYFNYSTEYTKVWNTDSMRAAYSHTCAYPPREPGTITIDI